MQRADVTVMPFGSRSPRMGPTVYLASGARIIGDVEIGDGSSIWCNAVVRGDVHWIRIGRETNVQDGCVLHVTGGEHPLSIGDRVTLGHMVTAHGCAIEDLCLIGIGSIVLDGAVIGRESFVAAGSLVTPGTVVPPRSMVMGRPARVLRPLRDDEIAGLATSADHYLDLARAYLGGGR